MNDQDCIAAIATPVGSGGIGIVRVSGKNCLALAKRFFRFSRPEQKIISHRLHYGLFVDGQGQKIDEILFVFMPAPFSYTGEDVVEIHCHGNPVLLQAVLDELVQAGCRLALHGEFTKRAFLNGRIDLTQAEAVGELIAAQGRSATEIALNVLEGYLGKKVGELRAALEEIKAGFCLAVDFPEEDIEVPDLYDFIPKIKQIRTDMEILIQGYERNRCRREGAVIVLAGKVNAGKSSLLNAFLGKERAIVTDIPGTTRDYIEEHIVLGKMSVRLVDTAGLRQTDDRVEQAGIERSYELAGRADIVLYLLDGREEWSDDENLALPFEKIIVVLTKKDLLDTLPDWAKERNAVCISSKTGEGIAELERRIVEKLGGESVPQEMNFSPNLRQRNLLLQAKEELEGLESDCKNGVPYDLAGVRLDFVLSYLQEITGEIRTDDVLHTIFSKFCIGK